MHTRKASERFRFVAILMILSMCLTLVAGPSGIAYAGANSPNVPYDLPVTLPAAVSSPAVDAAAPYTPAVLSIIAQILPSSTPTLAQINNANRMLTGATVATCNNTGKNGFPVGLNSSGVPVDATLAGGSTNMVLPASTLAGGNTTLVGGSTTLAFATVVGATNIKVPSVANFAAGQTVNIDTGADLETATIATVGTAGGTTVRTATAVGATQIQVNSITGFTVGQTVAIDSGANAETAVIQTLTQGGGPNPSSITVTAPLTLAHAVNAQVAGSGIDLAAPLTKAHASGRSVSAVYPVGATNLKVASVADFSAGQTIYIDTGASLESAVIAAVGTAGASGTGLTLTSALTVAHSASAAVRIMSAATGATSLKVVSTDPFKVGDTVAIDSGTNAEMATITAVGTAGLAGTGLTLAAPLTLSHYAGVAVTVQPVAGWTNIKVSSVANFGVGDTILIDTGANQELAVIAAVGTAGATGTGITLTAPLALAHATGVAVATVWLPGATVIKVSTVTGFEVGQTVWIDYLSNPESATVAAVGTAGGAGTGLTLAAGLGKTHNINKPVSLLTTPSVMPLCWTDGQGINTPQNATSSPMNMEGLAASFDRDLINAWGQVEGREARNLMVTGMLSPQVDLVIFPNWQRSVNSSSAEDPYLGYEMGAALTNGVQGAGAMAQVKHYGPYDGTNENANTWVPDQAMREMRLMPFEGAFVKGGAAAGMSTYHIFQVFDSNQSTATLSSNLNFSVNALSKAIPTVNPWTPTDAVPTWVMNESHWASENPYILSYTLHDLWGSVAAMGPDYGGEHGSNQIVQGLDFSPGNQYNGSSNPTNAAPTSSTCAWTAASIASAPAPAGTAVGDWDAGCHTGSNHIVGFPNHYLGTAGTGCPATGCGVVNAIYNGVLPLAIFNQSLARMLYQEERFGLLGCAEGLPSCTNPGGIDGNRNGGGPLPIGNEGGEVVLGTKNGDAAVVELTAERSAVLLKNDGNTLPIKASDLAGGIFVTGANAEINVAAPSNEGARGYADRVTVSPLLQLKALSGNASAFTYVPALDPTGKPVPCTALNPAPSTGDAPATAPTGCAGLQRSSGASLTALSNDIVDAQIDYSTISGQGQLAGNTAYKWDGWFYVPSSDTTVFRFQQSTTLPANNVTFSLDGTTRTLAAASTFYTGYYGNPAVPVSPTVDGYVQGGLTNRQFSAGTLAVGWHKVTITANNTGVSGNPAASFRFAYSRTQGDVTDAAAAAAGKSLAIVFANDNHPNSAQINQQGDTSSTLPAVTMEAAQIALINAVAAANPNTVVVLNDGNPVIIKDWLSNVKAVLEMWNPGQEGGTATARLLLGQANPSGKTSMTWPINATDTVHLYNEPADGLYPGSTAGTHPERLGGIAANPDQGLTGKRSVENEGIYTGYRYYDKLNIPVLFPFGYGLSYTTFAYTNLKLTPQVAGMDVEFDLKNTGSVAGAEVAQVYVGAGQEVAGVQQAVRALRNFERVQLNPGETKHVTMHLDERSFQYWSEQNQEWTTNWGVRTIYVGASSRSFPLSGQDAPLKPAAEEVLDLLAMVKGVGNGRALEGQVTKIQASITVGNTKLACRQINALTLGVRQQTDKSIPGATATAILHEAERLAASLGCSGR